MEEIIKVFRQYGYNVVFEPLHKKSDIIKYENKKDAVNGKNYFTILSSRKHVVGRLFDVNESTRKLKPTQIEKIIDTLSLFDIPEVKELTAHLQRVF